MRIDAYNQINSVYQTNKALKVEKTEKVKATDKVQISPICQDYQIAKKAINEISDVREDIVNTLKDDINTGKYNCNADAIADKLMEKMKEMKEMG